MLGEVEARAVAPPTAADPVCVDPKRTASGKLKKRGVGAKIERLTSREAMLPGAVAGCLDNGTVAWHSAGSGGRLGDSRVPLWYPRQPMTSHSHPARHSFLSSLRLPHSPTAPCRAPFRDFVSSSGSWENLSLQPTGASLQIVQLCLTDCEEETFYSIKGRVPSPNTLKVSLAASVLGFLLKFPNNGPTSPVLGQSFPQ